MLRLVPEALIFKFVAVSSKQLSKYSAIKLACEENNFQQQKKDNCHEDRRRFTLELKSV